MYYIVLSSKPNRGNETSELTSLIIYFLPENYKSFIGRKFSCYTIPFYSHPASLTLYAEAAERSEIAREL